MTKFTDTNGKVLSAHGCGRCSVCSSIKPASEFYTDKTRSVDLSSRCKSCDTARMRSIPLRSLARELRELAARHPVYGRLIRETAAQLQAA